MTVNELIEQLQASVAANPAVGDMMLVQSQDEEGNGYSPVSDISGPEKYRPETRWSGELLHPDDIENYDEETLAETVDVLCIWPIN